MDETLRDIEDGPEPELSELLSELDNADLAVLKRYRRFIARPTSGNQNKIDDATAHLYHSFGLTVRKILNGDFDADEGRVVSAATVIHDIAQNHHLILSDYATQRIQIDAPNWEQMKEEISRDLEKALKESPAHFSTVAINGIEMLIDSEATLLDVLSSVRRQRRIEIGKKALSSTSDILKVTAGTVLGIVVWKKLTDRD